MGSESGRQLQLFPFREVARNKTEFLNNLAILKEWKQDSSFTVQIRKEERESFLNRALSIGAYITTHQIPILLCDALEGIAERTV